MSDLNPIYKAPKKRVFDGKIFSLEEGFKNKSAAQSTAKVNREMKGKLTRIVKQKDDYFPYLIYTRKK